MLQQGSPTCCLVDKICWLSLEFLSLFLLPPVFLVLLALDQKTFHLGPESRIELSPPPQKDRCLVLGSLLLRIKLLEPRFI